MAHQLLIRDGRGCMMYVRTVPWHRLGTRLESPPTSEEAIRAAGLHWEVRKFPLFAKFGEDGQFFRKVKRVGLMPLDRIRSPECPVFGVVGEDYGIVQNSDAFRFFDPIVKEKKASYETAGALGEGERIWILAKVPGEARVHKNDPIDKYLLLVNSHTGLATVQIKLTPVRVVCNNTLTMALSYGESVKIPHVPDVNRRLTEAGLFISRILKTYDDLEEKFRAMAGRKFDTEKFKGYLDKVIPLPKVEPDAGTAKLKHQEKISIRRKICSDFFDQGHPNDPPEVRHTLWSAYNVITYYADYVMSLSDKMETARLDQDWDQYPKTELEKRLRRIWFGDSAALKVKAYNMALDMLKKAA